MKTKPNILLIMADQLTPFALDIYGGRHCRTPNINYLAGRGVVYDNAYTPCPLCTPARMSLMCGKFASRLNSHDNASVLPSDVPTIAHYMNIAGYETVLSGKMHFIGPDQKHGFARRLNTDIYPANPVWIPFEQNDSLMGGGGHAKSYTSDNVGERPWSVGLEYDEETLFMAQNFLRQRLLKTMDGGSPAPFFMCVSFHHPHDPFHVPKELWDEYKDAPVEINESNRDIPVSAMDKWLNEQYHFTDKYNIADAENMKKLRRSYWALTAYIDQKIGALLNTIKQCGLDDDTIVIFTSDHGDMLGERGMVQKRCFYEWSARIPFIMKFPDGRGAGTRDGRLITLLDVLPTLLDLSGCEAAPADMDGYSLMKPVPENHAVFSEYHGEGVRTACFMARDGRYKLIYIHGREGQLFDIINDPNETRNLYGEAAYVQIKENLIGRVKEKFQPEVIAGGIQADRERRRLIRESDNKTLTKHDYSVMIDGSKLYYREHPDN